MVYGPLKVKTADFHRCWLGHTLSGNPRQADHNVALKICITTEVVVSPRDRQTDRHTEILYRGGGGGRRRRNMWVGLVERWVDINTCACLYVNALRANYTHYSIGTPHMDLLILILRTCPHGIIAVLHKYSLVICLDVKVVLFSC